MNYVKESIDNPKLFQVYLKQAWHEVFCYALAFEAESGSREDKLLLTIVSGSDSALQSIRGAIDIGSNGGLKFGYGVKELTGYKFHSEKTLSAEKGKYEKFSMTLNRSRKALAIVHEDVLDNGKYVLSFDKNPAHDIAQLLGGSSYGLHILPEWEDTVLDELIHGGYLEKHEIYKDEDLFADGLNLYSINLTEEQADEFIEQLIKDNKLKFPVEGSGKELNDIDDLTSYLMDYNELMVEKISETVKPTHNPLHHDSYEHFNSYPRELFPVQSHTATAVAKRLKSQKAVIIQGEMSTGKSSIMTAVADGFYSQKNKSGYHVCLMCPPQLTKKWPEEIKLLIPHAEVYVIKKSEELIRYHSEWTRQGRPEPKVPTFFVIAFTTMRGDARTVPSVTYQNVKLKSNNLNDDRYYRDGFYCSNCGYAHQTVDEITSYIDDDGNEIETSETHNMTIVEFGSSRRLQNGTNPANAFCYHCGDSLWTKKVPTRYKNFADWNKHASKLEYSAKKGEKNLIKDLQINQPNINSKIGMPRRIASIEYIRRKMNNFFDMSIIDEVHELKGGMTAQGNALGSLVQASKKVVAGTGTLFGGKAEDVYYLLWRLFPHDMIASGFKYEEVTRFNEEYGNVEETVIDRKEGNREYSNTNSRGGDRKSTKKVIPGISPFIFGRYMIQNVINVRLKDVWPEPVELVDTPTIFIPMSEELKTKYDQMIAEFKRTIDSNKHNPSLYMQMTDYGIAYPDNPFTFPEAKFKNDNNESEILWQRPYFSTEITLPKEKKLLEIISNEMDESRSSIVYVRDTGSSVPGRDLRPRLKEKLEEIGAKVCILDSGTTSTSNRSEWLKKKIEDEGYDVCIVSQELVKTGLDLLCTPTLIYYQFSWSLFTINQSSRRAWRIGQTEECRLFYLAYEESFQQQMAELIAMKNRATAAINGEASSDGLSAMLGDEGDLQSMLIDSVKKGGTILAGSAEEWIKQTSDRARELLAGLGKKRELKESSLIEQFEQWVESNIQGETTKETMLRRKEEFANSIANNSIPGFEYNKSVLEVDIGKGLGHSREFISDGAILIHLTQEHKNNEENKEMDNRDSASVVKITTEKTTKRKRKRRTATSENQLVFDLFA